MDQKHKPQPSCKTSKNYTATPRCNIVLLCLGLPGIDLFLEQIKHCSSPLTVGPNTKLLTGSLYAYTVLLWKLLPTSPMSAPMAPITILVFLATLFALPLALIARPANNPTSRITVVGVVYCDTCSTKAFSRHSYFLPGADVHIQCTFKANSPKTRENIEFSVNRTTDRYGVYKLEVPEVDGVDCEEGFAIESVCQASLIGSSSRLECFELQAIQKKYHRMWES
ncbi:hypothetical protein OIU85_025343 [Salix viminalis]|uniref:Pollen Ole e 1 allergen and extensin family protein n=1 Tax=Salix viminalis TaxID=40686 RepID=A0A9Q0TL99_SALVM|nr:hypothetical protein OIU85_025343 [Salix viminalis]